MIDPNKDHEKCSLVGNIQWNNTFQRGFPPITANVRELNCGKRKNEMRTLKLMSLCVRESRIWIQNGLNNYECDSCSSELGKTALMPYENRVLLRHSKLDFQNDPSVTAENFDPTLHDREKNEEPLFLTGEGLVPYFPLGRMGRGSSRNNSLINFSCLLFQSYYSFQGEWGM